MSEEKIKIIFTFSPLFPNINSHSSEKKNKITKNSKIIFFFLLLLLDGLLTEFLEQARLVFKRPCFLEVLSDIFLISPINVNIIMIVVDDLIDQFSTLWRSLHVVRFPVPSASRQRENPADYLGAISSSRGGNDIVIIFTRFKNLLFIFPPSDFFFSCLRVNSSNSMSMGWGC